MPYRQQVGKTLILGGQLYDCRSIQSRHSLSFVQRHGHAGRHTGRQIETARTMPTTDGDNKVTKPSARNGIAAATLHLPPGQWVTVLECLAAHFAAIPKPEWVSRFERGLVLDELGRALPLDAAYRVGMRVHYYREVPHEPLIPFNESILYADTDLIVVDKPHFLPVSPVGQYVRETLLTRLQAQLGNRDLVPLHRIDRGTAGLVMFSGNPTTRDVYQALFRERRIRKCYEAIAPGLPERQFPIVRRSRLERGEPFVRSREVPGVANTETRIEVMDSGAVSWRYALFPLTGKKHQLRVHMAALGAPIRNDDFYPEMMELDRGDFSRPLQLLARSLSFVDPLSGRPRTFTSARELESI
jgi:tRNA pseudouridine32 synthase / 23S rRNA pseudouridine746 synthase